MPRQKVTKRIENSSPAKLYEKRLRGPAAIAVSLLLLALTLFALYRRAEMSRASSGGRKASAQAPPTPQMSEHALKDTAWDPAWPPLPNAGTPAQPIEQVRAMYAFAARHPEVLQYAPCYCGCENGGHESVRDCFVKGRDAMTMYHEGKLMAEIQRTIDDRYAHKYRTRTPTAKPPAREKG